MLTRRSTRTRKSGAPVSSALCAYMKMSRLLFIILLPLAACAQIQEFSTVLTESQARTVIERAREKIIVSSVVRDPSELNFVQTKEPSSFSYYFISKSYADYYIRWSVTKEETIIVHGRGNILELEGAIVERSRNGT